MDNHQIKKQTCSTVCSTSAPDSVLYLDTVNAMELAQRYKRESIDMLAIKEGHCILDVGCRTGEDVQAIAQLVGHNGKAIGIDKSEEMISQARQRASGLGLPIEFHLCDVHQLTFDDNFFDGCRAERVFQHLENPAKALSEIIRVSKSGAHILVMEPDWETLLIDSADHATTRSIVNFICDRMVRNGWIGRQLPRLFKDCGLIEIGVASSSIPLTDFDLADIIWGLRRNAKRAENAGMVSPSAVDQWMRDLEHASTEHRFFGAVTGFAVCGRKP